MRQSLALTRANAMNDLYGELPAIRVRGWDDDDDRDDDIGDELADREERT